jgi:hypothetical protein
MTWRTRVVVALAASSCLLSQSDIARAATTAELRSSFVITSTGPAAVALTTQAFELTTSGEQVQLSTTGSWVMFMLITQAPRALPGQGESDFTKIQLGRPAGCASDGHCVRPEGYSSLSYSFHNVGSAPFGEYRPLSYPAGALRGLPAH